MLHVVMGIGIQPAAAGNKGMGRTGMDTPVCKDRLPFAYQPCHQGKIALIAAWKKKGVFMAKVLCIRSLSPGRKPVPASGKA